MAHVSPIEQRNPITKAWKAEPILILTVALVIIEAGVAATAVEGYTWQSVVLQVLTAISGLVGRQSVFAPDTVEKLSSPESKRALDHDPSTPGVDPS